MVAETDQLECQTNLAQGTTVFIFIMFLDQNA